MVQTVQTVQTVQVVQHGADRGVRTKTLTAFLGRVLL